MAEELQKVCRELNNLTVHSLELMQDYINCNAKIEETMKFGFLNIAKARYIMGNHKISSLQLPNENSVEFNALTTVTLSTEDEKCSRFTLNSVANVKDAPSVKDENLRKRVKDETTDIDNADKDSDSTNTKSLVDPLKWFGVLVPQNLRQAQSSFKSAIELVADSATIQLELETTQNNCKQLQKKREELKRNIASAN